MCHGCVPRPSLRNPGRNSLPHVPLILLVLRNPGRNSLPHVPLIILVLLSHSRMLLLSLLCSGPRLCRAQAPVHEQPPIFQPSPSPVGRGWMGQHLWAPHLCSAFLQDTANTRRVHNLKPWAIPKLTLPATNYHPSGAAPVGPIPRGSLCFQHPCCPSLCPIPRPYSIPLTAPALPPSSPHPAQT